MMSVVSLPAAGSQRLASWEPQFSFSMRSMVIARSEATKQSHVPEANDFVYQVCKPFNGQVDAYPDVDMCSLHFILKCGCFHILHDVHTGVGHVVNH